MKILDKINTPAQLRLIDKNLLPELCKELRQEIISTIAKNGGHLGSSLGATDLIVALHYVFNSPVDKFVFGGGNE